jgi:putative membrane protein
MIQFVLLSMVMPPLFLIGLPAWLIQPVVQKPLLRALIRFVTRPGIALVLFTVVFSLFQLPLLLEATLRINGLYVLDQYLMMLVSISLWWPIYSPSPVIPALGRPLTLLYLFAMSLPTLLTFALITLAARAFYPTYIAGAHILGFSALRDQQVGGAVMKVATMLILLVVFIQEFFRWVHEERAKESLITIPTHQIRNPHYRPQHIKVVKDRHSDPGS